MNLFILELGRDPVYFGMVCLIVVFSICCHEYVHARTALFFGDDTAAEAGHLSLNPLRQMGWLSLVMLAMVGIAWGQVPVNPANLRRRRDEAWIALAGPATNFLLALAFLFLAAALNRWKLIPDFIIAYLGIAGVYNVMLGIFNLLPVPGLDGGSAVRVLLPGCCRLESEFAKGAYLTLIILLFIFFRYFWRISLWIAQAVLQGFSSLFDLL